MDCTVKQVAERVGLPRRTVRYYASSGLVSPAKRSEAGYRLYSPEDEDKLRFVLRAKALRLSLNQIRGLITAAERGGRGEVVPELERLLEGKVADIDARIGELRSVRERLVAYHAAEGARCACGEYSMFCDCLSDAQLIQVEQQLPEARSGTRGSQQNQPRTDKARTSRSPSRAVFDA